MGKEIIQDIGKKEEKKETMTLEEKGDFARKVSENINRYNSDPVRMYEDGEKREKYFDGFRREHNKLNPYRKIWN